MVKDGLETGQQGGIEIAAPAAELFAGRGRGGLVGEVCVAAPGGIDLGETGFFDG